MITGRSTYEAAGHWGDKNPWGIPVFVLTHRPEEQPPGDEFVFVDGLSNVLKQARRAAAGRQVHILGDAQTIRQALEAGMVHELTLIIAPVVLGAGKVLFDGFSRSIDLEHLGVRQSLLATFIDYRIRK